MKNIIVNQRDRLNINKIVSFLAKQDIEELTVSGLKKHTNKNKIDLLILLGNSIPYTGELAADAYDKGLVSKIMIVGGIGHSTDILRNNIINHPKYNHIPVADRSEAEILQDLIFEYLGEEISNDIILEKKSTNCGSNAIEALKMCKLKGLNPETVILIQDPTMQLRTNASFEKEWLNQNVKFINFAPFVPLVENDNHNGSFKFINNNIIGLWSQERFLSLVLGEIPRLYDDKYGYGPLGKGYIAHVDIPGDIVEVYKQLSNKCEDILNLRSI